MGFPVFSSHPSKLSPATVSDASEIFHANTNLVWHVKLSMKQERERMAKLLSLYHLENARLRFQVGMSAFGRREEGGGREGRGGGGEGGGRIIQTRMSL